MSQELSVQNNVRFLGMIQNVCRVIPMFTVGVLSSNAVYGGNQSRHDIAAGLGASGNVWLTSFDVLGQGETPHSPTEVDAD